MKTTKRLPGILLIALGVVGMVICLAGIVTAWSARGRLNDLVTRTFDRADVALTRLEDRTQRTNEQIGAVKDTLHSLNDRVQLRVAKLQDVTKEEAADIDEIERQLRARISQVQAWIEFTQSTVELIEQLFDMMASSSAFLEDDFRTMEDLVASLRAGREEVDLASTLFDEVQQGLVEIRARRNVEKNAKHITTVSSRIGDSLVKVEGSGQVFESKLSETLSEVEEFRVRIQGRLTLYTALASGFLFWMALGQLGLIMLGRRMLR